MFINLSYKYTKVGQKENIKLVSPKKIGGNLNRNVLFNFSNWNLVNTFYPKFEIFFYIVSVPFRCTEVETSAFNIINVS